ncbi:hypothetical protein R1sor_020220 [Riccia sorocarpa]|uniref:3'-5' exonuclease domain-containing protein n=1 Tax=Riccia sorocarpa TaxID=122646 RepID=A0ABD3IET1_9MARC
MASDGRRDITGTIVSSSRSRLEGLSLEALSLDTSPRREERRLAQARGESPAPPLYPDFVVTHIDVEEPEQEFLVTHIDVVEPEQEFLVTHIDVEEPKSSSRRRRNKKKTSADSDGQSSASGRSRHVSDKKCTPQGEPRDRDTTEWESQPPNLEETEPGDAGADGMRKQKRDQASNRWAKRQQSQNVGTQQWKSAAGVASSSGWDDDLRYASAASPSSSTVPDVHSVDAVDHFDAGYFDEQINILGTDVTVRVAYTAKGVAEWIDECPANEGIFGFDIEWKPNFVKGQNNDAALCQLACAARCLIVQLLHIDYIPEKLKAFLADPRKKLVGVGVKGDISKLSEAYDLTCRGEVDLGAYAAEVFKDPKLKQAGLTTLSTLILDIPFKKSKRITTSNWAVQGLSYNQIVYAASDAWIAYSMLTALESKQRNQTSTSIAGAVPHLPNQGDVQVARQGR